ncbi:hypothetical protein [Hymenobacter terrestris]|uniref:Right-handed parallel beta-helix repeat-containing protein n=1 Tax=Hymenobacter terrestris TaxID=2748310 RepID=A0ABX2PYQ4_9BACT|nr:hypothetical protein [Hymenobacter terrestris]NVO83815.1 hypothetical protein [Hymenobacter terrestris]
MTSADVLPKLSGREALSLLQTGKPVCGHHIVGRLLLPVYDTCAWPVTIENCWLDEVEASGVSFKAPVHLLNSHINKCAFTQAHFLQGLQIENCVFDDYLDFSSGGHNQPGFLVCLQRNVFHRFVNFFDCWYRAEVRIEHNDFRGETNLLSSADNYTTFDVEPLIQDNTGNLHRVDEGELPTEQLG